MLCSKIIIIFFTEILILTNAVSDPSSVSNLFLEQIYFSVQLNDLERFSYTYRLIPGMPSPPDRVAVLRCVYKVQYG